jgi:4-amino-4-deoxy-L-arabinose transferase-like glycosyltransferase
MNVRSRTLFTACGWGVFLAVFAMWVGTTANAELRDQLRRWQFWFLELQFAALLPLTAINVVKCVRRLGVSPRDYVAVAAAATLALLLAGWAAPLTNRIYYDEQIYQGVAQNLGDLRLAQMCNDGTVEYGQLQCWRGEYNKQPYGYPYLLSVVYRGFGVSYWTAARVNVLVGAITVVIVFLLAATLFQDLRVARLAAVVTALMPELLLWSHTAAAEPSAAAAAALAALAAAQFVRTRTTTALAWTAVATAFALQFRTESIVAVIAVATIIAVWAPSELRGERFWRWALVGAMLSAALFAHLVAVRNEGWGAAGEKLASHFIAGNLRTNGRFYVADHRFPVVYTLLALVAIAVWRDRRAVLVALAYFCVFAGVYLGFYAGSYDYGNDVRYSLMTFPPLALLAGAGGAVLVGVLERTRLRPVVAEGAIVAALAFQFLNYLPLVRATGEEAWAARADIAFAERVAATLPKNSIVLTHNPSVFLVMGRNAAQLSLVSADTTYVRDTLLSRYPGGVFLHWNFWCNVDDQVQQQVCASALARFPHSPVAEYRERDYQFAFHRLGDGAAP